MTNLPSRPAKGELLTLNWMAIVGSSMVIGGNGWGFSTSQKLSPMVMPGMPAMATMSPICAGLFDVGALEAGEAEELGDLVLGKGTVDLGDRVLLTGAHGAVEDATDGETTEVVGVVEVGDEDLDGALGIALGDGDGRDDLLEEGLEVGAGDAGVCGGGAELAVGVEDGEVENRLVGVEIDEEVVDLVEDFLGAPRASGRSRILLMTTMGVRPASRALERT